MLARPSAEARDMKRWAEHVLHANGHEMAWYETGRGSTLLCLHGSYDHLLYRPMAELLADRFTFASGLR
jgi:hypothetical protein